MTATDSAAPRTISVVIVDDHPIVRSGLRAVLTATAGLDVLAEAASGEEAVDLARTLKPEVVLCDFRLGGGLDGAGTTLALRELSPAPAVVILSTSDRDSDIVRAVEAGAAGYLLKDSEPHVIAEAIREASQGKIVLSPELTRRAVAGMRQPRSRLTRRETEVLAHLAVGESNRDIARALFVTEATVKTHLVNIFAKLGADSRTEAVALARDQGLI